MNPPAILLHTLRALADDTRLRMLALLASGEVCVCHMHGALGIPQPTASRHLAYLRKAGLVEARRDGQWVHYRLAMPDVPEVAAVVRSAIAALDTTRRLQTDRQRLSGLTRTPVRAMKEAAACCLDGTCVTPGVPTQRRAGPSGPADAGRT